MVTGIAVAPPMWEHAHGCWHNGPPMLNTVKHSALHRRVYTIYILAGLPGFARDSCIFSLQI